MSNKDNVILKNEFGYAALDTLYQGQQKQINFFIDPPKDALNLDIKLIYEDSFIMDCLLGMKWTGSECDSFRKIK
jgi:hypothetical protein